MVSGWCCMQETLHSLKQNTNLTHSMALLSQAPLFFSIKWTMYDTFYTWKYPLTVLSIKLVKYLVKTDPAALTAFLLLQFSLDTVSHRSCCKALALDGQQKEQKHPTGFQNHSNNRGHDNIDLHPGSVWLNLFRDMSFPLAPGITAPQLADTTSTSQEHFLKVAKVRLKPTGCWHWKNWSFTLVHYLCLKKLWYKTSPLAWSCSHSTGCTESPFCVPLESFRESEGKSKQTNKQINLEAVFMLEK